MAELIDILRVEIGPENMMARVRIADDGPLMTSEDLEGTARVYRLLPHIVDHACLGDAGEAFRDAMGDTEIAHLLEHVTVELLAQTDLAGDMPTGRTWVDEVDDRTFEIELACPDDVLVAASLSTAAWILDWAYADGAEPEPDVDAIVSSLVELIESVGDEGEDLVIDRGPAALEDEGIDREDGGEVRDEEGSEGLGETPERQGEADDAPEEDVPAAKLEERRSLWTPAPEIPVSSRPREERRVPEVEAEVDQIMATLELPVITADGSPEVSEGEEGR